LKNLLFETCELHAPNGITSKTDTHYVFTQLDPNNTLFMDQLYHDCASILNQYKIAVKIPKFNVADPEGSGFKYPIYREQGKNPSMYLKLYKYNMGQTLFTDSYGNPVPWDLLYGTDFKFIPLLHIKKIYVGYQKASICIQIKSAVITSVN
jgi:hypothetical protein